MDSDKRNGGGSSNEILSIKFFCEEANLNSGYCLIMMNKGLCLLDSKQKIVSVYAGFTIFDVLLIDDYLYSTIEINQQVTEQQYSLAISSLDSAKPVKNIHQSGTFISAINLNQLLDQ